MQILGARWLPPGVYSFYFLLDMNANGRLDFGKLYYDLTQVAVTR